jgi:hypothetical protein
MLTFSTFAIAKSEILNSFKRDRNFVVNFWKTKGAMNKMRLEQNEIGKNLSLTKQKKSRSNSARQRNEVQRTLNEMRLLEQLSWKFESCSCLIHAI